MTGRRMELKRTVRRMEMEVNEMSKIEVLKYLCPTCRKGSYLVDLVPNILNFNIRKVSIVEVCTGD